MNTKAPKRMGLLYDKPRAIWNGVTAPSVVPVQHETLKDARGAEYQRWHEGGYRFNRFPETGQTTAYLCEPA